MSRDLSNGVVQSLEDDVIYPFYAVELQFDGDQTLRLWTGVGSLVFEGETWIGTGQLLNVTAIEETSEIAVRGATLTLSGVPQEVISLALTEPYHGRVCKVYFGLFQKGQLLLESSSYILLQDGSKILLEDQKTSLTEIFSGYMDQMNISEDADSSTIQLKAENKLIDLERPRVARYTSAFQKARYPNDKGFDFVESLQDQKLTWGRRVDN